jgi:hypothetical protein
VNFVTFESFPYFGSEPVSLARPSTDDTGELDRLVVTGRCMDRLGRRRRESFPGRDLTAMEHLDERESRTE